MSQTLLVRSTGLVPDVLGYPSSMLGQLEALLPDRLQESTSSQTPERSTGELRSVCMFWGALSPEQLGVLTSAPPILADGLASVYQDQEVSRTDVFFSGSLLWCQMLAVIWSVVFLQAIRVPQRKDECLSLNVG